MPPNASNRCSSAGLIVSVNQAATCSCKCLARWRSAIWHADGGGELTPRAYDRSPEAPLTAPCLETKARGQVLVPAPKQDTVRTTRPRSPPSDRKSNPSTRRRLYKRFLTERSDERRVGNEWLMQCRSWGWSYPLKKKK